MEFYEITTGTSQKDIDNAINDMKKIAADLFTQSFMYSATETLLQIYYASHIIGANNIIKQITSKECDPYGLIDDSYTKAIKDNNWAVLYDKFYIWAFEEELHHIAAVKNERDSLPTSYTNDPDYDYQYNTFNGFAESIINTECDAEIHIIHYHNKPYIAYRGVNFIFDNTASIQRIEYNNTDRQKLSDMFERPMEWNNEPTYRKHINDTAISLIDTPLIRNVPKFTATKYITDLIENHRKFQPFISTLANLCYEYDHSVINPKGSPFLPDGMELPIDYPGIYIKAPFILTVDHFKQIFNL